MSYRQPPRTPQYFPRMKVRGARRRWAEKTNKPGGTLVYIREGKRDENVVPRSWIGLSQ